LGTARSGGTFTVDSSSPPSLDFRSIGDVQSPAQGDRPG
jgi:hypothetical protein